MRPVHHIEYDRGNKIYVLKPHEHLAEGVVKMTSQLAIKHQWPCGNTVDYGIVGRREISKKLVDLLAGAMAAASSYLHYSKYHGLGTDTTAEDAAQIALIAEITDLTSDGYRVAGSQVATLCGANEYATYYSSATITSAKTGVTVAEHGICYTDTPASSDVLDRTLIGIGDRFAIVVGSVITSEYTVTYTAGS